MPSPQRFGTRGKSGNLGVSAYQGCIVLCVTSDWGRIVLYWWVPGTVILIDSFLFSDSQQALLELLESYVASLKKMPSMIMKDLE